jgi:hypothetical protein
MTNFISPIRTEKLVTERVFYSFLGTISKDELKLEKLKNKAIPLNQIIYVHFQKSQTFLYNKVIFFGSFLLYIIFVIYLDIFLLIIPCGILFILSMFYKHEIYLMTVKLNRRKKIEIIMSNSKSKKGKLFVQEINRHLRDRDQAFLI